MKKLIYILTIALFSYSCNNNDDNSEPVELVGEWLLIEQYSDPGDGSGDYTPVNSNKTVTFLADGSITSNGNLCSMDISSVENSEGTYDAVVNTISLDSCFSSEYTLRYEIMENRLFIYYPCIEGCGQKFRKSN